MIHEVFMPALSSTMTEGKIVSWTKSPGDPVEKGETVVVIESDKADMDVESFYAGFLAVVTTPAGESAPVGATIGLIAETEAEIAEAQAKVQSGGGAAAAPAPEPALAASAPAASAVPPSVAPVAVRRDRTIVSPRARKLAKQLKVDLATLQGSGPHGRIVAADVETAAGRPASAPASPAALASASTPTLAPPVVAPSNGQGSPAPALPTLSGDLVPFNTLQQAVVRNMVASLQVPTFHVGYTITTDGLDHLYKQVKSKGVTMTALLAKAIAVTLRQHPLLNACYAEQGIQHRSSINVAVAVAMPGGGLITPVLQNADQIDLYSLSRTWKGLVERSRAKQLQPEEYSTGTFTMSNLGMYGVNTFDAILPPGQGSILAIGASQPQLVAAADGLFGVKRQMQVNLTCDHRVIYGADAAAFLKDLSMLIETNPQSLTL
ncbi:2-oxo acid dehydrogenase subunit E2 [Synechococcales cyanobacterium C]|uniref:Dihydrolipoamide acetyltransferase component of pyruvate dehydrogenase complex n=1 Tax=Petrachloros mirabilis ULC683 TaxID=2781853 RepID=A0A8K2A9N8_9CYAN|nr:dihydrolipoamide acetyltransferase family protein [Petrachloros mirabilis]NCJ08225.1 2-oxo acid dehydrogenase subunit E2 [Petrachloros mirabilis ULC683]